MKKRPSFPTEFELGRCISDQDRSNAQNEGANRLCLRLADVTDRNNGESNPGTLQEVIVDSHSTEWYLPIPLGGRDYKVELGYRIGLFVYLQFLFDYYILKSNLLILGFFAVVY